MNYKSSPLVNVITYMNDSVKIFLRLFFVVFVILSIIVPIVLQLVFKWDFIKADTFFLGFYTIYILLYLSVQLTFSLLNNLKKKYLEKDGEEDKEHSSKKVNMCVVGYREDPTYFKNCLESMKKCAAGTFNFNRLYVVVDGRDEEDLFMKNIFLEVFGDEGAYFDLEELPSKYSMKGDESNEIELEENKYGDLISEKRKYICITQPHAGKRHGLYTAFKLSIEENKKSGSNDIKAIFCTDSDSIVFDNTVSELYKCLVYENVGASTGILRIMNKYESMISFVISLRYWYSFVLERAYQSFNKCVLCVSGPIALYKLQYLENSIDEWVNQKFLGQECTYGDDRHLTNKILRQGKHIVFNPNAACLTETPDSVFRFFKQQIRWAKSSYREYLWNVLSIHKQSVFMAIDLTYQGFYSFFVLVLIFFMLYTASLEQIGIYITCLFIIGLVKGIYASVYERNAEYMFFATYGYFFLTILIPARLYAMISMYDISWGTSSRNVVKNKIGFDFVFFVVWQLALFGSIGYNIYDRVVVRNDTSNFWWLVSGGCLILVSVGALMVYTSVKRNRT